MSKEHKEGCHKKALEKWDNGTTTAMCACTCACPDMPDKPGDNHECRAGITCIEKPNEEHKEGCHFNDDCWNCGEPCSCPHEVKGEKHCGKCSYESEEGLVVSGCAYCGCHTPLPEKPSGETAWKNKVFRVKMLYRDVVNFDEGERLEPADKEFADRELEELVAQAEARGYERALKAVEEGMPKEKTEMEITHREYYEEHSYLVEGYNYALADVRTLLKSLKG